MPKFKQKDLIFWLKKKTAYKILRAEWPYLSNMRNYINNLANTHKNAKMKSQN